MKMNEAVVGRRNSLTRPVFTCYAALRPMLALIQRKPCNTLEKVAQSGVLTIGYQDAPPFSFQDDAEAANWLFD